MYRANFGNKAKQRETKARPQFAMIISRMRAAELFLVERKKPSRSIREETRARDTWIDACSLTRATRICVTQNAALIRTLSRGHSRDPLTINHAENFVDPPT
jgi:hypothetical protein